MFALCISLEDVDVSSFNTSNVVSMGQMFAYCFALKTLDLSSFDTSNVQLMNGMFNCNPEILSYLIDEENPEITPQLTTIYVSSKWNTDAVTWGTNMFYGCTSLVGGAGTVYNASLYEESPNGEDVQYARIDGGTEAPGYFTEKVISAIVGDVTGDGVVNSKDVNKLVNIILGKVTSYDATIADVNEDSAVNISDVTALVNLLLRP
jgi:surface protein